MSNGNTLVRSVHDVGAAAWFGGSLMGAVGLNGASEDVTDPADRSRVAAAGWARWSPVNAVAIGAHLLGGLGVLIANRDRARVQAGVRANTNVKTVVTLAALGTTAYSGVLGARIARKGRVEAEGGTKPAAGTPTEAAESQRQLRLLQWATPVLTGAIVVLGAIQGEQQRPGKQIRGVLRTALPDSIAS